jgi:rhamnosyltransferase
MSAGAASVIVRTRDNRAQAQRTLAALRRQDQPLEIVVVDSESTDGTRDVAARVADQLVTIPAATYTPGRALNAGAAVAGGEIHFAVSAHCPPPDEAWVSRSLAHYTDTRVAATNGTLRTPDGQLLTGVFLQGPEHTRAHPMWGFSNHASSWRAAVWEGHRFDESLPVTGEDRKWSWEVIDAGWLIAFDPALWVDMSHRWRAGTLAHFRRLRDEQVAIGAFADLPAYPLASMLAEWWATMPDERHSRAFHRANPRRMAGLAGRYVGRRMVRG